MRLSEYRLAAPAVGLILGIATALPAAALTYPDEPRSGINFDLGIDVSGVPLNARAVDGYIASLEPETQAAVVGACQTYMQYPESAKALETLSFCRIAVGG